MQRSISYKNHIKNIALLALFFLYESLSGIYQFLPPLFAVLLILFILNIKNRNVVNFLYVCIALLIFEAQKGYIAFSSIIYAFILYKVIIVNISNMTNCQSCIKLLVVALSYPGYFLFLTILSNIFILPMPQINFYALYYMLVEYVVAVLLIR